MAISTTGVGATIHFEDKVRVISVSMQSIMLGAKRPNFPDLAGFRGRSHFNRPEWTPTRELNWMDKGAECQVFVIRHYGYRIRKLWILQHP